MNAAELRDLVVAALQGKTTAGSRVYSPRDWPTSEDEYPIILVQTPFDEKMSLGRAVPEFTTVTTVRITGRVQALDSSSVLPGAAQAELAVELLREQVDKSVINSYELTKRIQQFKSVRSTIDVNADGDAHLGQLVCEMDIEYYQGPEDFYPVESVPLAGIDTTPNP
jgi:hypothetical protein